MRWSDDGVGLWLLDLCACESYWHAQATMQGTSVLELLRTIVGAMSGAAGSPVRAVLADHPWQAVLLQRHMRERRLSGLVVANGPFGASLYRELTWDVWWSCTDVLMEHLLAAGGRLGEHAAFRRQREQMRRAVRRMGLELPWQLEGVEALAIKRRFGNLMHDLWRWAYGSTQAAAADAPGALTASPLFPDREPEAKTFASGFPWRGFVWPHRPQVSRHLDAPLCEWEHIEPFLREDFDRLCALPTWQAGERVVSLEWRLVFHDMSCLTVPVRFRHPHLLHLERGSHATALLQALYAFEGAIPRQYRTYEGAQRRDETMPAIPIAGWELVLAERLTLPARSVGLFGDQLSLGAPGSGARAASFEEMAVLQLENKLPIALEAYDLRSDWLPEDSFHARAADSAGFSGSFEASGPATAESLRSLTAVALRRPLYLYRQPRVFKSLGHSSTWRFSERTMAKWWQKARQPRAAPDLQRDYYRLTDGEQRVFWVFKDTAEQWFIHGVFA
jgi:hypothetical protein